MATPGGGPQPTTTRTRTGRSMTTARWTPVQPLDRRAVTHTHPHPNDMQPVRCTMSDAQPLGAQSATTYRQSRQGLALQTRAHAHEAEEALQVCGPHARREQRALLTEADAPVSARQGGASPQHTRRRQRTRSRTMSRAVSSLSRLRTAPTASMRGELHRQERDARRSTTHTHTHTHTHTRTCSHP